MPPEIILLENITIRYRAPKERIGTLKEYAIRRIQRRVGFKEFLALDGVSFSIYRGEILGLIGRNGAGKSTLLKVISRVLAPSEGRVRVCGRVAPLLELGAGFHPELTGRENILVNGTLLGHTRREIEAQMESILEFAELGSFIEAPLRTYSSGMVARLGFAVATAWQPEILIVDEILAVGDEAFRMKCQARMRSFCANGATVVLVTHNMETLLSMCTRAAWLEHGRLREIGQAAPIVEQYRSSQPGAEKR